MHTALHYLQDGSVIVTPDSLLISDKSFKDYQWSWFGVIGSVTYALTTTLRGYREQDDLWFYFGIGLLTLWLLALGMRRYDLRRPEKELFFRDLTEGRLSTPWLGNAPRLELRTRYGSRRTLKLPENPTQYNRLLAEIQAKGIQVVQS